MVRKAGKNLTRRRGDAENIECRRNPSTSPFDKLRTAASFSNQPLADKI